MKLESLTVSGFRGFAEERHFDLSADVILVHGPNGSGKTSFFDAVLWAVTGTVDRLGPDSDLVSRYSEFGEARVVLELRREDDSPVRIVRRFDGQSTITVDAAGRQSAGAAADAVLLDLMWPEAKSAPRPGESLSRSVTHAIYLQQDQVRSFLEAEDEQSRFAIVAEIVGAGRIGELLRQLETSRKAWNTATNRLRAEAEPLLRRREQLRAHVAELSGGGPAASTVEEHWATWASRASIALRDEAPSTEGDRTRVLDRLLEGLRRQQRRSEQRLSQLGDLSQLVERLLALPASAGLDGLREEVAAMQQVVAIASTDLANAETSAADTRRSQVQESQERESLAALAHLALRHLGKRCPVCTQEYDRELTQAHLRNLLESLDQTTVVGSDDVLERAESLRIAERHLADAQTRLRESERQDREIATWHHLVATLAAELGFTEPLGDEPAELPSIGSRAQAAALETSGTIELLHELRSEGEGLALALARLAEFDKLAEIRSQLKNIESECERKAVLLAERDLAGRDATQVIEALREVGETLVGAELDRIEPLIQRIYSSVDPHPSFRAVRFLTETKRGRGHLWTSISDSVESLTVNDPKLVLSSSQLNVLAVVAFLALNLSVPTLPLQVVALDDPLQSLDNVNLLGLCDLLRRLRRQRQVIVSTHDDRLAGLLERKLRPVLSGERTSVIQVDGWSRVGPLISQRDVPPDAGGLRLVQTA